MSNPFHRSTTPPDPDVEPGCGHMLEMLNGLADGSAHGIIRWYAEHHIAGCPECAAALVGLQQLRIRLQTVHRAVVESEQAPVALQILSVERRAAIEAAWDAVDKVESKP